MKSKLIEFLNNNDKFTNIDIEKVLEKPRSEAHGDVAMPMFLLAKEMKMAPPQIATDMKEELSKDMPEFLEKIEAVGPFLNFYFNKAGISKSILLDLDEGFEFMQNDETLLGKKILIEYPSPNTNKALHIGHVRNILLGNSLKKILKKTKYDVVTASLNNDRGIAICKAMLMYEMFGEDSTPESKGLKPDKFAESWYVLFGKKNEEQPELELEKKAQEMLVKWEEGDGNVRALWKKFLDWVYAGYKKTYEDYKFSSDKFYLESESYDKGKEIVLDALSRGVKGFGREDDGAVFVDLEEKKLGKKYLLRADGTTLYMTMDLFLAGEKEKDFNADKYIFIVGSEQRYHFDVLFEVLSRIKGEPVDKNFHFAYGYVYDKDGKKFSSRKGEVFAADEFRDDAIEKATEVLREKAPELDDEEVARRAEIIGYGALVFSILKINPLGDINFDLDKALSFEGETAPYVQYTYARIKSIIRKFESEGKELNKDNVDFSQYGESEASIAKLLGEYNSVLDDASLKYKPSSIANFLIKVCQKFNEFYHSTPILKDDDGNDERIKARVYLCRCISVILKDGLDLLDIEVLEEM